MAGLTNNTTILKGVNQLIKAINDLAACLCGTSTSGQTNNGGENSMACCCVPGGNFGTIPGQTPTGPTTQPLPLPGIPDPVDPETDPPPEGFTSWAQFYMNKCQVANKIVDDLIQTLHNLASLEGILATVSAGALFVFLNTSLLSGLLVGLMAVGFAAFDAAAIVIGALIVLAVAGLGGLAFFEVLANSIDKAQLVCDIYLPTTPQGIYNDLKEDLQTQISGLEDITDLITDQIIKIIMALLNNTITNMPFEPHPELWGYISLDPVDCASCSGGGGTTSTCFDFEDGLQGWTVGGDAVSFSPFPEVGDISNEGGTLRIDLVVVDNQYGIVSSPIMSHIILTGEELCIAVSDSTAGSFTNYVEIIADGDLYELAALSGTATGLASYSLEDYVGLNLDKITIGFSRLGSGAFVKISKIGVCSEGCEED